MSRQRRTVINTTLPQPSIMYPTATTAITNCLPTTIITAIRPVASTIINATSTILDPQPAPTSTVDAPVSIWSLPSPQFYSLLSELANISSIIYMVGYMELFIRNIIIAFYYRKEIAEEKAAKQQREKDVWSATMNISQETTATRQGVDKVGAGVTALPEAIAKAMAGVISQVVAEGYEAGAKNAISSMEAVISQAVAEGIKDAPKEMHQTTTAATKEAVQDGVDEVMGGIHRLETTIAWGSHEVKEDGNGGAWGSWQDDDYATSTASSDSLRHFYEHCDRTWDQAC